MYLSSIGTVNLKICPWTNNGHRGLLNEGILHLSFFVGPYCTRTFFLGGLISREGGRRNNYHNIYTCSDIA